MNLEQLYSKYVVKRKFYRVVPSKSLKKTLRQGLVPKQNPFKKYKTKIRTFLQIVDRLSKKGYKMYHWWGFWADEQRIIETKRNDLSKNYIDFCNSYDISMYRKLKGGAMIWALHLLATEIIARKMPLTPQEEKAVVHMKEWTNKKIDTTHVIQITASDKALNSARLRYGHNLYLPCPFGTFANFSKRIKIHGLQTYLPYLTDEKKFFIRCTQKISPASISVKEKSKRRVTSP